MLYRNYLCIREPVDDGQLEIRQALPRLERRAVLK